MLIHVTREIKWSQNWSTRSQVENCSITGLGSWTTCGQNPWWTDPNGSFNASNWFWRQEVAGSGYSEFLHQNGFSILGFVVRKHLHFRLLSQACSLTCKAQVSESERGVQICLYRIWMWNIIELFWIPDLGIPKFPKMTLTCEHRPCSFPNEKVILPHQVKWTVGLFLL